MTTWELRRSHLVLKHLCTLPRSRDMVLSQGLPLFLWFLQLIYGQCLGQGVGQTEAEDTDIGSHVARLRGGNLMWQGFPGPHWVVCRGRGLSIAWGHLGANDRVLGTEDHSICPAHTYTHRPCDGCELVLRTQVHLQWEGNVS